MKPVAYALFVSIKKGYCNKPSYDNLDIFFMCEKFSMYVKVRLCQRDLIMYGSTPFERLISHPELSESSK